MEKSDYIVKSFVNAAGVFAYMCGVALLFFNSQRIFGDVKSFLIPVFILLLFVVSASITSLLVLGKPILLYLDNLKKEAFTLLLSTLA